MTKLNLEELNQALLPARALEPIREQLTLLREDVTNLKVDVGKIQLVSAALGERELAIRNQISKGTAM